MIVAFTGHRKKPPIVHILEDTAEPVCGFKGKMPFFVFAKSIGMPSAVRRILYCKNCRRRYKRLHQQ